MRYAARTDRNHAEIRDALRSAGIRVIDCARMGNGFPDLCCLLRGNTIWIEIKRDDVSPSRSALTADQSKFHESARMAGVTIHVVRNVDEALSMFGMEKAA